MRHESNNVYKGCIIKKVTTQSHWNTLGQFKTFLRDFPTEGQGGWVIYPIYPGDHWLKSIPQGISYGNSSCPCLSCACSLHQKTLRKRGVEAFSENPLAIEYQQDTDSELTKFDTYIPKNISQTCISGLKSVMHQGTKLDGGKVQSPRA